MALPINNLQHLGAFFGVIYATKSLTIAILRGYGIKWAIETDVNHQPGLLDPPSSRKVNRGYHWRHHFENPNAYFSGILPFFDKLMGTALSLKGKTIAVTGASGALGKTLLHLLHQIGAKVIALTSKNQQITLQIGGENLPIKTISWQVGKEVDLIKALANENVDILIINHGINVYSDRTASAIAQSYEVNTFSSWRLMEGFLSTICTNKDRVRKEVWVNTSEAEVYPAFSPIYELTKRALGDLVTLRRLDAPCVIRKLILGPFKSQLNPQGKMSVEWIAKQIINMAQRDVRNIIVSFKLFVIIRFPVKEFLVSLYFRLFSSGSPNDKLQKISHSNAIEH